MHQRNQRVAGRGDSSTINACWQNLWSQAVKNFRGFPTNTEERHGIAGLACHVRGEGFDDMEPEELDDLIASHAEEELETITITKEEEMVGRNEKEEASRANLTVNLLGEMLQDMRAIADRLQDANLVMELYLKFKELHAMTRVQHFHQS